MTKPMRTVWVAAVVAALGVGLAASAYADCTITDKGGGNVFVKISYTINGVQNPNFPGCQPTNEKLTNGGTTEVLHWCSDNSIGGLDDVVIKAGYDFNAVPPTGYQVVWVRNNASAGSGDQIESVPDSTGACVGLYTPPGGFSAPRDSMFQVQITRSGTQVTLGVHGGLQVRGVPGTSDPARSVFHLLVYPDSNTANADFTHSGVGSSFNGSVQLTDAGTINASGGFSAGDFAVTTDATGKYTARTNVIKVANVPNASLATVVMIGDPMSRTRAPATSNWGLALLIIALIGSGLWVMRSRRRVEVA
jgi:hypothetical protein